MFYTYNQNNSGGSFKVDNKVAHYVIVEADNDKEANRKAEDVGIYFNGVDHGHDCPCCGDRWYPAHGKGKGKDMPMIYGKAPEDYEDMFASVGEPYCIVYYKDGNVVKHIQKVKV